MSPEDISGVMKKVQTKMGGALAEDFVNKISTNIIIYYILILN